MNPVEPNNEKDHETLVAYLDGELDHAATVEVETRLAADPAYRRQLQYLEQTWDMLDELPAVEPTDSFTRSTLELVVADAQAAIRKQRSNLWSSLWKAAALLLVPCLCYFATTGVMNWWQYAPVQKLIDDVPFLQKYELYETVGKIEFASLLDEQKLLADIEMYDPELITEKFAWEPSAAVLDSLTDEERVDLRRAKVRFETRLTEPEREALQKFHKELLERPDRDELLSAMKQFQIWSTETALNNPKKRETVNSLSDMDPSEAIETVKTLLEEERRSMGSGGIPRADKDLVFKWFDGLLLENDQRIRTRIAELKNSDKFADYLSRVTSDRPINVLAWILIRIDDEFVINLISDEQLEELKSSLSGISQRLINGKANETEQRRFIVEMNTQIYVSQEKLREFYDTQMTNEERKELEGVTGAELRESVRRRYIRHRFRNSSDDE